jgi:Zn-dependent M16 (insulinase) family peptidase
MYILSTNHLWEKVRGIGGAYGISGQVDMLERLCTFQSYRDPRISGTYQDIFDSLQLIEEKGIEQKLVDNAIITIISRELRPEYPQRAAMVDFRRTLYHISDEFRNMRREFLLETTHEDIQKAAQVMRESLTSQKSCVAIAGSEIFEKEKADPIVMGVPIVTLPV